MRKHFLAFIISTALTVALAGNALATFGELSFVRVIDQKSGGTTEVLSNLGTLGTTVDLSAQNVILSSSNVLNNFNGAALSSLTVSYTSYQINPDSGYTFDIWVGGSNTTAPKTAGGMDAQYQSNMDQVIQYANRLGGTTANEVIGDTSNRASYFKKMNPTGQYGSNGAFTSLDSNSNASLANLATTGYVDQTIYYFSGQVNPDTYQTDPSTGIKVATIRTSYDAATGMLTCILNPPIPTISGVSPDSLGQGAQTTLVITGNNLAGASVSFGNSGVIGGTPEKTSTSTEIQIPVSVSPTATTGNVVITITTANGTAIANSLLQVTAVSPPTISSISPGKLGQGDSTLTITGTSFSGASVSFGNSGVTGGTPTIAPDGTSMSVPVNVALGAPMGNVDVTVAAPVGSAIGSFTVIDTTSPTVTDFSVPTATQTSKTVSGLSISAADNVAVTGYLLTETPAPPSATDPGLSWSPTVPDSYLFADLGLGTATRTLYAWARDAAGNVSDWSSVSTKTVNFNISVNDTTAPVVTSFAVADSPPARFPTVKITAFTATDDVGVANYLITTSPAVTASTPGWSSSVPTTFTVPAPGQYTLYAWAKDGTGNISASKSATVTVVDQSAPTVTAFSVSSAGFPAVQVKSLVATDDVGVAKYMVTTSPTQPLATASGWSDSAPATFTVPAPGQYTLYAWAKDAADNVSIENQNSSATVTVNDTSSPTVSAFVISSSGFPTIQVTSLIASDDVGVTGYLLTTSQTKPLATASGWSSSVPATFAVKTPGAYTLYAWARDGAGNVSAAKSATVTVEDKSAPTITAFSVPTGTLSNTNTVPNIFITANDDVGVAGYTLTDDPNSVPSATADGVWSEKAPTSYTFSGLGLGTVPKQLYAWAKDAAGNVSKPVSAGVTFYNPHLSVTLTSPPDAGLTSGKTLYTSFTTIHVAGTVNKQDAVVSVQVAANGTVVSNQAVAINDDLSFRQAITLQMDTPNIITITAKDSQETLAPISRSVTWRAVGIADAMRALRIGVGLDKSVYPNLNPADSDAAAAQQAALDAALDVSPLITVVPPSGASTLTAVPDGVINVGDAVVLLRQAAGLVQW